VSDSKAYAQGGEGRKSLAVESSEALMGTWADDLCFGGHQGWQRMCLRHVKREALDILPQVSLPVQNPRVDLQGGGKQRNESARNEFCSANGRESSASRRLWRPRNDWPALPRNAEARTQTRNPTIAALPLKRAVWRRQLMPAAATVRAEQRPDN